MLLLFKQSFNSHLEAKRSHLQLQPLKLTQKRCLVMMEPLLSSDLRPPQTPPPGPEISLRPGAAAVPAPPPPAEAPPRCSTRLSSSKSQTSGLQRQTLQRLFSEPPQRRNYTRINAVTRLFYYLLAVPSCVETIQNFQALMRSF